MDSRLIAGAYSQHFRALEREQLQETERKDSVTKAKRLSQETNKRRKFQAQKRKLEAQREERRRQDILTKRREEQKQATEKYQRSHIPQGSRQNSGRSSPRKSSPRRQLIPGLDDALKLIRRNVHQERPHSGRDRPLIYQNENEDPLKRAYFTQPTHHSGRPPSGRSTQSSHYEARAQLMDYSMKNLTSSKSLFEQQLEQQQSLLLEQQQKSMKEFNEAIQKEIHLVDTKTKQNNDEPESDEEETRLSENCSSIDSLENSYGSEQRLITWTNSSAAEVPTVINEQIPTVEKEQIHHKSNVTNSNEKFYLNQNSSNNQDLSKPDHIPLNIDLTPSATFQKLPPPEEPQTLLPHPGAFDKVNDNPLTPSENDILPKPSLDENISQHGQQQITPSFQMPLKQVSTDSLAGSESSDSSISIVRIPDNNSHKINPVQVLTNQNQNSSIGIQSKVNPPYEPVLPFKQSLSQNDRKSDSRQVDRLINQTTSQGQTAWASNTTNLPSSNRPKADPVMESYNPRYASAIGLSIWPGQTPSVPINTKSETIPSPVTTNSQMNQGVANSNVPKSPYGTRNTSIALVGPVSTGTLSSHTADKRSLLNQNNTGKLQGAKPSSTPVTESNFNISKNESGPVFNQQDFAYPLPHASSHGQVMSQNPNFPPSPVSVYNNLQAEISQLSKQMVHQNQTGITHPSQYSSNTPQFPQSNTHSTSNKSDEERDSSHILHHATGAVPVPAVRTVFHVNRPPVPASNISLNIADEAGKKGLPQEGGSSPKDQGNISQEKNGRDETLDMTHNEDDIIENEPEPIFNKPLKGILKQLPPKVSSHGQSAGKVQARDSVELARLQHEKKQSRKKSVRFAEHHIEENYEEYNEPEMVPAGPQFGIKNSYKHSMIRPASAKIASTSPKFDFNAKQPRASSAGTRRPHQPGGGVQHTSTILPDNSSARINLPVNFTQPLNTSPPINRPKAAAHIIMSSDSSTTHNNTSPNGQQISSNGNAATVHKSQLETKVKTVNNNFMSKVPVKTAPKVGTSPMVYHVTRQGNNTNVGGGEGGHAIADGSCGEQNVQYEKEVQLLPTQADRSRIRDPVAKRIPLSNTTVTRTSIVPASTKINYPLPNGNTPSYSVSTAQGANTAVFDENGLRVDRTPTDEEITWLWDKVRNCLDKEEDKTVTRQTSSNGSEQMAKPTPVLSTKLIDGASLGFNSAGATGLRPGSGYFYPRAASANASTGQNKAKPVVQQQGSYLRRYGLLQQRRTNSASAINSGGSQSRGGSAGFVKYSTVPNSQQSQQQQVPQSDMPTPMAYSYRPQDNVSESTAAFVMAERLVKQSLSDSHIALGMDDAQNKQEMHNNAKLPPRAGGPSTLSLEEQKLMESLDKLNERLKVNEHKYPGTIHFHQPYQPHLPGFRGHQGLNDSRRQGMAQTIQPRSQSARIRQQIRQYR